MKCKNCRTKNSVKANYCIRCGGKFTPIEKKRAYSKTIFGKYEKIEDWYDNLLINRITNSWIYKTIVVLLILAYGIYLWSTYGIDLMIRDGKDYKVYYNSKNDEYYLIVDKNLEKVPLNLYIPNRLSDIKINHYNINNKKIETIKYNKDKDLTLETYNDDYYILTPIYTVHPFYKNKKGKIIKIYLYNKDSIKLNK